MENNENYKVIKVFFDNYFVNRDFDNLRGVLSDDLSGFGLSNDEIFFTKEEFQQIFQKHSELIKDRFKYNITDKNEYSIGDNKIFTLIFNLLTEDDEITMSNMRISFILNSSSLIEHFHLSYPAMDHDFTDGKPTLHDIISYTADINETLSKENPYLSEALHEIDNIVSHDKMTGLYHNFRINDSLISEVNRSLRYGNTFSIMLCAIDNFDKLDKEYLSLYKVDIFKTISEFIVSCTRNTDICGLKGDNKFIAILPETEIEDAVKIAEKLGGEINELIFPEQTHLTLSFGLTQFKGNDSTLTITNRLNSLLDKAIKNDEKICFE